MTNKELPEMNVGVVGHIDHGKTTLLSKLSGKFTDTHSEELKRGITIKLGYADAVISNDKGFYNIQGKGTPVRYISFIDAPGHEMLMATMLSGAAIIDAAILVIAANEGIKPQTMEHFSALQAKKIKNIIIVQNKIDLVTKEQALKNYNEIKKFVKGTIAENSQIIPASAQQEINIDKILEELTKFEIPARDAKSNPIFLVARSFDINRPGTIIENLKGGVLGGILKKGTLRIGEEIEIKPGLTTTKHNEQIYKPLITKIISLHKGKNPVKEVFPGTSISIETELDPSLTKSDALVGCLVSKTGILPEITYKIKVKEKLLEKVSGTEEQLKVEPIKPTETLMLSVNTTITVGKVEKIKGDEAEILLKIPIISIAGDNVGIARNINGHWRLIGWGNLI